MKKYKVLYISGSIGLGHVIKNLAIAHKLRTINPDVEITWIATNPATDYLEARYIIRFDPEMYSDKMKVREKLGYGEDPLIICSIGGTSIGKNLLDLCNKAYPLLKSEIRKLHMVLVTGP